MARIPSFKGQPKSTLLVTDSVVMFKRSRNKAAAARFLEFFYRDEWRLPFDQATGFTPVTRSLASHPAFQAPVHKTMIASTRGAKGWPLIEEWRQCHEMIWEGLEPILAGYAKPQPVLNEVAAKIDGLRQQ